VTFATQIHMSLALAPKSFFKIATQMYYGIDTSEIPRLGVEEETVADALNPRCRKQETAPALRQLLGFNRRVGARCEGLIQGVQEHFSVQRVGVYPGTKAWR
jgi:hypothetical protein